MIWINLSIVLMVALLSAFGVLFIPSAWKRRGHADAGARRMELLLPGLDCGLCGMPDCPSYADSVDAGGGDPALCLPGGSRLESRLRNILSERKGDARAVPRRAIVRCGGRKGEAAIEFVYDGRPDCRSAAGFNGGQKRCKDACLGFGSCVAACPQGAIRVSSGLAVVRPELCTGCGACESACPVGVISMIPREQTWYVACSSRRDPDSRERDCSAACTGCGLCVEKSVRGEFAMAGGLARENPEAPLGRWSDIADLCPTRAIAQAGAEKRRPSPFPARKR